MSAALLDHITDRINKMEDDGAVDEAIVDDLDELKQKLLDVEDRWLSVDDKNSFYFYQGIRDVELILERMVERFKAAKIKHDNPQIALDTLAVIPIVNEIIQIAEHGKADDAAVNQILERTHQLRDKAHETNLIESDERNLHEVDKETLGKSFDKVLDTLEIPSDLPDDVCVDEDKDIS